jgi:uncharacterized delta-60 repeat protein
MSMRLKQPIMVFVLVLATACEGMGPTEAPDVRLPSFAASAPPTLLSETTWGGADNDVAEGVAVAPDGSSYLVGLTRSFDPFGTPELFTVKFDANGSLAWQRTWDAPGQFVSDEGREAAVASDGSVYVTGLTFVDGNRGLLLKFSSDGTLLWQRVFGGNAHGDGVTVGSDGSVYVTGGLRDAADAEDLFVIKLSADGTLLWFKTWGDVGVTEHGQGIAIGPDGNVYVAGVGPRQTEPFLAQFDAVVLKMDPTGNLIWQRSFPGGDVTDSRGGIDVAPDGSVYVAGGFQGPSGSGFANDGLMLKLTSEGELVWARRWDGAFAEGVAVAPDGRVVFVGQTTPDQGGDDVFMLRLQPNGKVSDASTWGGGGFDGGRDVDVAPNGTIVVGAFAEQPPYTFAAARARTSRARLSVSTPTLSLMDFPGVVVDPGGLVETPSGTTTYGGQFDAALVMIAP